MTNVFLASDLFIPLPRPEYVALPEGFLSSLAWKALTVESIPKVSGDKKIGLRYILEDMSQTAKSVEFRQTMPTGTDMKSLGESLEKNGLEEIGNENLISEAVLNSIRGTIPVKSKFVPASPLSPALALLQNPIGLVGKANPADFANILETIYALGKKGMPDKTVSTLWYQASQLRLEKDSVLRSIDSALSEVVWGAKIKENVTAPYAISSSIRNHLENSPFSWFAETWDKITSEDWVVALPARVWVDWATCVLRTAYAMAYLWEASWYESLAKAILDKSRSNSDFVESVINSMDAPIIWRSKEAPAEIRDLSSKLKWRCYKSLAVKATLQKWVKDNSLEELEISEFVEQARANDSLQKALQTSLSPNKDSSSDAADHLWEAIKYALITRGKGDHYGFLESVGSRYLFATPGIEWGAMIASLAAGKPGKATNLGEVSSNLLHSGTQAQAKELLSLLERTGLARGSADADLALQVENAYKQGDKN